MENTQTTSDFGTGFKEQEARVAPIDTFFSEETSSVISGEATEPDDILDLEGIESESKVETKAAPEGIEEEEIIEEEDSLNKVKEKETGKGDDISTPQDEYNSNELLGVFVEKGIIDESLVIVSDTGEETPLLEAELSPSEVAEVLERTITEKVNKANEGKVSVKGISEFTKQLINIEKNGGNVKQALESYKTYKAPMDNIDISTEEGQYEAIFLTLEAKGLPEKDIKSLIDTYIERGQLEDRAKEAKTDLDEAFNKQMNDISEKADKKRREWDKFIEGYAVDIKSELDKTFELNDEVKNKIVSLASKENSEGKYDLDGLYNKARLDPKKAAKLALFLMDTEEYNKQISNNEVDKTNRKTFSKMRLSRRDFNKDVTSKTRRTSKKEVSIEDMD